MPLYGNKPVEVEAVQWWGQNFWQDKEKNKMLIDAYEGGYFVITSKVIYIKNPHGEVIAQLGDFIIKGLDGEYYAVRPEVFHKTYGSV